MEKITREALLGLKIARREIDRLYGHPPSVLDDLIAQAQAAPEAGSVAFYWQDVGYPSPNRHGPYFGWPDEMAIRNVDGGSIPVPLYTHPAPAQPSAVPDVCDGKEQGAFEGWAQKERFDMSQHPLHWLFLDPKTHAARQGWVAAIRYVRTMLAAAPNPQQPDAGGLVEALEDIANDYSERFDMDSPSTNPGMKIVVENARAALAAYRAQQGNGVVRQAMLAPVPCAWIRIADDRPDAVLGGDVFAYRSQSQKPDDWGVWQPLFAALSGSGEGE